MGAQQAKEGGDPGSGLPPAGSRTEDRFGPSPRAPPASRIKGLRPRQQAQGGGHGGGGLPPPHPSPGGGQRREFGRTFLMVYSLAIESLPFRLCLDRVAGAGGCRKEKERERDCIDFSPSRSIHPSSFLSFLGNCVGVGKGDAGQGGVGS